METKPLNFNKIFLWHLFMIVVFLFIKINLKNFPIEYFTNTRI